MSHENEIQIYLPDTSPSELSSDYAPVQSSIYIVPERFMNYVTYVDSGKKDKRDRPIKQRTKVPFYYPTIYSKCGLVNNCVEDNNYRAQPNMYDNSIPSCKNMPPQFLMGDCHADPNMPNQYIVSVAEGDECGYTSKRNVGTQSGIINFGAPFVYLPGGFTARIQSKNGADSRREILVCPPETKCKAALDENGYQTPQNICRR